MSERILVPLDGSKVGEAGLTYVEQLVSKVLPEVKVEVILLHVISSLTYGFAVETAIGAQVPYTEKEIEQIKEEAKKYLDETGEFLRNQGATVETKVATGNVAREITKVATDNKVGLIVMSTHTHTRFRRLIFGSITDKILQRLTVPVLMVRAPTDLSGHSKPARAVSNA